MEDKNAIKYLINNFIYIEFAVMIVSIVSSFVTIYQAIASNTINLVALAFTALIAILIIILATRHIYKIITMNNEMFSRFSEGLHKLNHRIRDAYFETKHLMENGEITFSHLSEKFLSNTKESINCLSNTLTKLTNKDIYVCIKVFEPIKSGNQYDVNNACVSTLCRSSNTMQVRISKDCKAKIADNTAFYKIFVDGESEFYATDLIEYSSNNEYRNSNKHWRKNYKCSIVVPIRIENKFVECCDGVYDIIGFVCVDSNSTNAFTKENIEYYVNIVKSFADTNYIYFKQYQCYADKLNNQ